MLTVHLRRLALWPTNCSTVQHNELIVYSVSWKTQSGMGAEADGFSLRPWHKNESRLGPETDRDRGRLRRPCTRPDRRRRRRGPPSTAGSTGSFGRPELVRQPRQDGQ